MTEVDRTAEPDVDGYSDPQLSDPWSIARPIPLSGRLEKSGFPPWLTLGLGLLLAFVLLIGQIFGLLVPALLFARMHSSNYAGFLRIRSTDVRLIVLAVVGLFALIPVVHWIGMLSDSLPWPEFIREFEQAQMDLIERILVQDFTVTFALSMMALTPAVCEELLFRGYIQRQAERSMGIWGGILFSGFIFGLYHLRPTQAVPLALLGIYLAYLTWRSGSILPAMIVHFANNAFAVALSKIATTEGGTGIDLETFQFPYYVLVSAALVLVAVSIVYHKTAGQILSENDNDYSSSITSSGYE